MQLSNSLADLLSLTPEPATALQSAGANADNATPFADVLSGLPPAANADKLEGDAELLLTTSGNVAEPSGETLPPGNVALPRTAMLGLSVASAEPMLDSKAIATADELPEQPVSALPMPATPPSQPAVPELPAQAAKAPETNVDVSRGVLMLHESDSNPVADTDDGDGPTPPSDQRKTPPSASGTPLFAAAPEALPPLPPVLDKALPAAQFTGDSTAASPMRGARAPQPQADAKAPATNDQSPVTTLPDAVLTGTTSLPPTALPPQGSQPRQYPGVTGVGGRQQVLNSASKLVDNGSESTGLASSDVELFSIVSNRGKFSMSSFEQSVLSPGTAFETHASPMTPTGFSVDTSVADAAAQSAALPAPLDAPADLPLPLSSSLAMGTYGWMEETAGQVSWLRDNDQDTATLQLHPQELGRLDITIEVKDGHTHVHFYAGNQEARELLNNSLPTLRDLLAQNGLQLGDSQVNDQQRQRHTNFGQFTQSHVASRLQDQESAGAALLARRPLSGHAHHQVDFYA